MEVYKLLVQSYMGGRGRTLDPSQVVELLTLITGMDNKIGELMAQLGDMEVVDAILDEEEAGQSGEGSGLDSSEEE